MAVKRTKSTTKKRGSTAHTRSTDWKPVLLAELRECGNIGAACEKAQIGRTTFYDHKRDDPKFAEQVAEALEDAGDVLEREAFRRAVEGIDEPVFGSLGNNSGSGEIGTIRKYSDTLLIFLLKGTKPDKFRERYAVEHAGNQDKPIVVKIVRASAATDNDQ
jgi:hypothetical protein